MWNKSISKDVTNPLKINSFIFSKELMGKMINSIILSNEINEEIGFVLCAKDDIVVDKFHCKGEKCSSIGELECESGEIPIGFFHVYPRVKSSDILDQDIEIGYKYGLIIGGGTDEIFFMVRNEDYRDNVYQEMLKIINEAEELEMSIESMTRHIQSHVDILELPLTEVEVLKGENIFGIPLKSHIGQYVLPIDVIEKMKEFVEKGNNIGIEVGFELHASNNMIISKNECVGEEYCIKHEFESKPEETIVGGFHVHPHSKKVLSSISDLRLVVYGPGVECIGTEKEIKCFIRRKEFDKSLEKLIGDGELLMEEKERTRKIKEEFALKYFNGFIRKISE
jgi:hypothetical protein